MMLVLSENHDYIESELQSLQCRKRHFKPDYFSLILPESLTQEIFGVNEGCLESLNVITPFVNDTSPLTELSTIYFEFWTLRPFLMCN